MTQTPITVPAICTERQVKDRVALIADEVINGRYTLAAHLERELWADVLETVAGGHAQAGYLAAAVLETKLISFPRG